MEGVEEDGLPVGIDKGRRALRRGLLTITPEYIPVRGQKKGFENLDVPSGQGSSHLKS